MAASTTPARESRQKAPTDIDRDIPGFARPSLSLPRPTRGSLHLIHLGDVPRHLLDRLRPGDEAAIVRARDTVGIPEALLSAWLDPGPGLESDTVRGLPLGRLPVVGRPRYRLRHPVLPVIDPKGRRKGSPHISADDLSTFAGTVVVHLPERWDDPDADLRRDALCWLARAQAVVEALPDAEVAVIDGTGRRRLLPSDLPSIVRDVEPLLRFRYSYALNMSFIAGPALAHALKETDADSLDLLGAANPGREIDPVEAYHERLDRVARRTAFDPDGHALGDPLTLQVLFAIRRAGRVALSHRVGNPSNLWMLDLVNLGREGDPAWVGSGRHAPRKLTVAEVEGVAKCLVGNFLLREADGGIALSRSGHDFLNAMHPDCEDVDLPCRWRGLPLTDEDGAAMDDWIGRRFSKMRRRVDAAIAADARNPSALATA